LGDCILWAGFLLEIFGLLFSAEKKFKINFDAKLVGIRFWPFFPQAHSVTLTVSE
jgi:hypothetical protein